MVRENIHSYARATYTRRLTSDRILKSSFCYYTLSDGVGLLFSIA
uniref:Uncharacterized protein n=1 Tax=Anopheles quadriannulatus TaxID=34691 RepID=A0A182XRF4_ANOQN